MNEKTEYTGDFNNNPSNLKRSTPGARLDTAVFEKRHLAVTKGSYDWLFKNRNYLLYGNEPNLRLTEIIDPTTDRFLEQLKLVGKRYGWDQRLEFQKENRPHLDELMTQPTSRLFIFERKSDDQENLEDGPFRYDEIGFCFVTGIPSIVNPKTRPAFSSSGKSVEEIISMYKKQEWLENDHTAIEINKIGLYDEFTGQGLGNYYLAQILKTLFEREKHNIVYLNTRNTNHAGVINFYAKNGIKLFMTEVLPNDLVDYTSSQTHNLEHKHP